MESQNRSGVLGDRHMERIERLQRKIRREKFSLCLEKARLITESYRQTEGEPEVIQAAKAWAHLLQNIPIFIGEDEYIIGEGASKPWGVELDPFLGVWDEKAIRGAEQDGLIEVAPEEWDLIRELGDYWKTRCVENTGEASVIAIKYGTFCNLDYPSADAEKEELRSLCRQRALPVNLH